MAPNLRSVDAKIGRAKTHSAELKAVLEPVLNANTQHFVFEKNAESGHHILRVFGVPEIDPSWGLIAGDCIHNLRSALDHLACRLVELDQQPVRDQTYFPIYKTALDKNGNHIGIRMQPPIRRADIRGALEECQPYNARNVGFPVDPKSHPLWKLKRLDDTDKHRLMLFLASLPDSDNLGWAHHKSIREVGIYWHGLKDGAPIARFRFAEGEKPMDYNPRPPIRIALNEPNLGDLLRWHLPDFLDSLIDWVETMVLGGPALNGLPNTSGIRRFFV